MKKTYTYPSVHCTVCGWQGKRKKAGSHACYRCSSPGTKMAEGKRPLSIKQLPPETVAAMRAESKKRFEEEAPKIIKEIKALYAKMQLARRAERKVRTIPWN